MEKIRERTNEVPSYKRHYDRAEELGLELEAALKAHNKSLDNESVLSSRIARFQVIKDRALDRFDQQSVPPPAK